MKLIQIEKVFINVDAIDFIRGAGSNCAEIVFRSGQITVFNGYTPEKLASRVQNPEITKY